MQVDDETDDPIQLFRIWLKVIVRDKQERVLLVKDRHNDGWELPGNGWEKNIDLVTAIHKVIRDETGVEIREPKLHQIASCMYGAPIVYMYFSAKFADGKLSIGPEISDIKWAEPNAVEELLEFSSHIRAFQDSLVESTSGTRHRIVREYDGTIALEDFDTF